MISDRHKSFVPVWIIILEYLRLELSISFRFDLMLFALAPGISLIVAVGVVADFMFLKVESPINRTSSSAPVLCYILN